MGLLLIFFFFCDDSPPPPQIDTLYIPSTNPLDGGSHEILNMFRPADQLPERLDDFLNHHTPTPPSLSPLTFIHTFSIYDRSSVCSSSPLIYPSVQLYIHPHPLRLHPYSIVAAHQPISPCTFIFVRFSMLNSLSVGFMFMFLHVSRLSLK